MKKLSSIADVLNFAIAGETKAAELYMKMAAMVENPWMQMKLEDLAAEELRHRKKLKSVRIGRRSLDREDPGNLGIAQTLDDSQPHANMDYRELLAFAIKKENASHGLYKQLAMVFEEPELKETFQQLAAEEAAHKRRFEMEYESLTS